MAKFLERPDCTCFKPEAQGTGENITNSCAAMIVEDFVTTATMQGICNKALWITAIKTFAGIIGGISSVKCNGDVEQAKLVFDEYLTHLGEDLKHWNAEVYAAHDNEGNRLQ